MEIRGTLNCLQTDGHKMGRARLWRKGQHRLRIVLGSFRLVVSGGEALTLSPQPHVCDCGHADPCSRVAHPVTELLASRSRKQEMSPNSPLASSVPLFQPPAYHPPAGLGRTLPSQHRPPQGRALPWGPWGKGTPFLQLSSDIERLQMNCVQPHLSPPPSSEGRLLDGEPPVGAPGSGRDPASSEVLSSESRTLQSLPQHPRCKRWV